MNLHPAFSPLETGPKIWQVRAYPDELYMHDDGQLILFIEAFL